MKINNYEFNKFATKKTMRMDFKFYNWFYEKKGYLNSAKLGEIIDYSYKGHAFKGSDFSSHGNIYVLKGTNFKEDFTIDYDNIEFLPDNYYHCEKYSKFAIEKDEIIISLVGSIGKMVLIEEKIPALLNQNNISIKLKQGFNPKLYIYILENILREIVEVLYKVSGYSFISVDELFDIDVPIFSKIEQKDFLNEIIRYEKELKLKSNQIKSNSDIINEKIIQEFDIDMEKVMNIEIQEKKTITFKEIYNLNSKLRLSYRFNKAIELQKEILSNCDCIGKLSLYNLKTKNGWSPTCNKFSSKYIVLGIDSVNIDTHLTFDNLKYCDEEKENMDDFFIKENDLFLTRGNTTDLVAMASIARNINDKYIS
ncbi:restriction endonuclease subunit S domain-containing protein [Tissierella creatinophila]|uniref:EcoKI restriction-modification system protein HsdS n=1 Tax=Tissierella creatinophila DSM 6911 TaxID=1123403 RepID=A0A1U7M5G1_TISCR|nr:hypothetical protein [Tissierella creatinophila]OLS02428.1 EcoKI restriction-modification system protein HsdS [Tissierella creatinophila DSM 6911]